LFEHRELVLEGELDVDALDRIGVIAHAIERYDDIFVDLESIRVPRNGRGAAAIDPEFLARLGIDGDKAFARACIRESSLRT
jgi:hypothetical protein